VHDGSGRITVQGLTKQFGPVTAVQNLTFTVQPGSVTGFLGPNGAGKTTTLRMALGLVRPTAGTATINGVPFAQLGEPGRVVGAVLEAQGLHPKRTALNHLKVYAAAIGMPDSRAEQVLQLVGLAAGTNRAAGSFSLGMKQRLALATALLGDPQILVLDEPANGLDPEGIAWLRSFLQAFARSGRTVLISSHILAEVEQTVDQVVIISNGQTMYNGPLDHLRQSQQGKVLVQPADPNALMTALRDQDIYNIETMQDGRLAIGGVTVKQIADVALAAGVSVYGIQEEKVNLEQLYFALTNGAAFGGPPAGQFQQPQFQQPYQSPGQQPYQQPGQPPYQQPYQQQQPYQPPPQQYAPPQPPSPYAPPPVQEQPPSPYAPPAPYQAPPPYQPPAPYQAPEPVQSPYAPPPPEDAPPPGRPPEQDQDPNQGANGGEH
jgi:ABC-2 type transport system ATP-binding protein